MSLFCLQARIISTLSEETARLSKCASLRKDFFHFALVTRRDLGTKMTSLKKKKMPRKTSHVVLQLSILKNTIAE